MLHWSADWPAHAASCSVTHTGHHAAERPQSCLLMLSPQSIFCSVILECLHITIEMGTKSASFLLPPTTPSHQRSRTLHLVFTIDSWDLVSPLLKSIFFVRKSHYSCGAEMRDVTKYGCCCESWSWHKCNQLTQFQTQKLPLPLPHPSND